MNRADYMAALRRALSVLPEEERANALRYYEEYFDDAGPENEAKAIEELGEPAKVAAQILADYRELTAVPHAQPIKEKRRWRGISPLLLIVLVLLAIPIGLPLVFGAGATVLGVLLAIVVTVLAVIFAVLLILYGIPLALICGGAVIALLSCTLWATPANALVTLGNGLAAFAAGILLGLLSIKLSILFVPPVSPTVCRCSAPLSPCCVRRLTGFATDAAIQEVEMYEKAHYCLRCRAGARTRTDNGRSCARRTVLQRVL